MLFGSLLFAQLGFHILVLPLLLLEFALCDALLLFEFPNLVIVGMMEIHSVHDAIARGMVFTPNHIKTLLGTSDAIAFEGDLPGGGTSGLQFLGNASPASTFISVATTIPVGHQRLPL